MDGLNSRRSFLKAAVGLPAAGPFISRIARGGAPAAEKFDPNFGTATEALRAIRAGVISSRELSEHTFERIKKFNPRVNAFVTLAEDRAMAQAREADDALAAGKVWGPLHGLPIVIKDSFATAGLRTTSGSKTLESYVPKDDAMAVRRLKRAGAIIIGKTNLPEFAGDVQSFNQVAGTTNNPWDTSRTPGGSTGGGAAALAAGFGFLELGSDIGGSIRTPSHFCGVYGHKPSLEVVPRQGHIPPLPPPFPIAIPSDLPVAGPMARGAHDLLLELEVLGGPAPEEAVAYRWTLPQARGSRLKDYRIGYILDDPFCPVSSEVAEVLSRAVEALRRHGVELIEGWPAGVNPQATFDNYIRLLAAFFSPTTTNDQVKLMRASMGSRWGYYAKAWLEGTEMSHKDWLGEAEGRFRARLVWQDFFKTHDAFLMPENFVPAFPHDHNLTFFERTIRTPEGPRLYGDVLRWISFATLSGCPATVAPVGRTKGGLPVGVQIMGPYLEEATPIDIAARLADVIGGFESPPGFSA